MRSIPFVTIRLDFKRGTRTASNNQAVAFISQVYIASSVSISAEDNDPRVGSPSFILHARGMKIYVCDAMRGQSATADWPHSSWRWRNDKTGTL